MGMMRIASSRIVGRGDRAEVGYFSLNLSANSVMRGTFRRKGRRRA